MRDNDSPKFDYLFKLKGRKPDEPNPLPKKAFDSDDDEEQKLLEKYKKIAQQSQAKKIQEAEAIADPLSGEDRKKKEVAIREMKMLKLKSEKYGIKIADNEEKERIEKEQRLKRMAEDIIKYKHLIRNYDGGKNTSKEISNPLNPRKEHKEEKIRKSKSVKVADVSSGRPRIVSHKEEPLRDKNTVRKPPKVVDASRKDLLSKRGEPYGYKEVVESRPKKRYYDLYDLDEENEISKQIGKQQDYEMYINKTSS